MKSRCLVVLVFAAALALTLAAPFAVAEEQQSSPARTGAGSSVPHALDYLKARQQPDGGFAEPGGKSTDELTAWVVCGVCSTGMDVKKWKKSGKSAIDFLAATAGDLTKLTEIEKDCLAVCSAGVNPRSFGGRNLVEEIKGRMAADGHIGDMTNEHCWGVIALAAAGEKLPDGSKTWLAARQNIDGGFGYGSGAASEPDDTGAALQALMAAGDSKTSNAVTRALACLHICQADDGGFTYQARESNVGSTAWAVQGIFAAGQDATSAEWASSAGNTPFDYLASMQQSDGHFRYMASVDTNLAWMTAETIPALYRKPYPYNVSAAAAAPSGDTAAKESQSNASKADAATSKQNSSEKSTSSDSTPSDPSGAPGTTAGPEGAVGNSEAGSSPRNRAGPTGGLASKKKATAGSRKSGGARTSSAGILVFVIIGAGYLALLALACVSLVLLLKSRG